MGRISIGLSLTLLVSGNAFARDNVSEHVPVSDQIIAAQYQALDENTRDKGFGPQSPRDIDAPDGSILSCSARPRHHPQ